MNNVYIFPIVVIFSIFIIAYGNSAGTNNTTATPGGGPNITRQPLDVFYNNVTAVDTVEFIVEAEGNPCLIYQWYFKPNQGVRQLVNLSDPSITVTNGTLRITRPVETRHGGGYQCRVENNIGAVLSSSAQLVFYCAQFNQCAPNYMDEFPNSTRSPVTVDVNFGGGLECNPPKNNYRTLVYSWYKTTVDNVISSNNRTFVSSDGRLYFQSVNRDDAGDYFCVVSPPNVPSNSSLRKTSLAISLRVTETVATPPFPAIVIGFPKVFPSDPREGESVRLECEAYGMGSLNYSWTLYDKPFPTDVILSDNNRVITIPRVTQQHAGFYICSVNRTGRDAYEDAVELAILSAPYFTTPLKAGLAAKGSTVVLACVAEGNPSFTYKWYGNATEIDLNKMADRDRKRYSFYTNRLFISNVQYIDAGMYQCSAENIYGERFSTAQLSVEYAPPATIKPYTFLYYGNPGESLTLMCIAYAPSDYKKTWYKEGQVLTTGSDNTTHYWINSNGDLRITNVTLNDVGNYSAEVRDPYGTLTETCNGTLSLIPTYTPYEYTWWKTVAIAIPSVIGGVILISFVSLGVYVCFCRQPTSGMRYGGV